MPEAGVVAVPVLEDVNIGVEAPVVDNSVVDNCVVVPFW